MPVAERPASARNKSLSNFKEKPKVGRLVQLLVCGILITITSDVAYLMLDCVKQCPARTSPVHLDKEEQIQKATTFTQQPLESCAVVKPIQYYRRVERDSNYLEQDNGIPSQEGFKFNPDQLNEDADPTRKKNIMMYQVMVFTTETLRDFAMYKGLDAMDILSNNIAFTHKAGFFMPSF